MRKGRFLNVESVNQFNHIGFLAVINPTDRPKLVHNSCLIECWWHLALFVMNVQLYRGLCQTTVSDLSHFPPNNLRLTGNKLA